MGSVLYRPHELNAAFLSDFVASSQSSPSLPPYSEEREAAGDLGVEQAAAMRAVIQVSEAPLFLGFGGRGEMHGFSGPDGRHGPGGRIGGEDRDQDLPGDDESPAGLPNDDDTSNQSASAPVMPAESVAIS